MNSVLGIHHVTAVASDPQRNLDFYAGLLGLRLVKRTVNFDDPHTYHFYYGDEVGTPGGILTFFPIPGARRGRIGSGQVAVTSFAVAPGAIAFWVDRLTRHGVAFQGPSPGASVLAFKDPDGLMLEIVGTADAASRPAWGGAPGIPHEHALHGFDSVTLWVEDAEDSARVLVDTLGLREAGVDGASRRFAIGDGGPGMRLVLRAIGGFGRGVGGAGTVHHVAWAVADDAAELAVRERVIESGLQPTPVIDRNYFHSVYFREPGGVLYELATLPPGFAIDEPVASLGESLKLPAQYEPRRAEIEAVLPLLRMPDGSASAPVPDAGPAPAPLDFVHRWIPSTPGPDPRERTTLLLLHGTGGDEHDLLALGGSLWPGAGMLSPRGKVSEHGANRFFRRLAEGVFDLEDLARRTDELAAFLAAAAERYGFDPRGIVAVGFSNGANIAASLLLRRPGVLRGAVLLSPMVPFEPVRPPALAGTSVFVGAGRMDPIAPPAHAERLAAILRSAGADVTSHWSAGGHSVTPDEVDAAREWLRGLASPAN